MTLPKGPEALAEGKTKIIWPDTSDPDAVIIESKSDITAGDGAQHDILAGKAAWSTQTTCRVFELIRRYGTRVAYVEQLDTTHFRSINCDMLPYEVVARGEAHGSYCTRHPDVRKGYEFAAPITELYLKTSNRTWKGHSLVCDDPLLRINQSEQDTPLWLFNPKDALHQPFLKLPYADVFTYDNEATMLDSMLATAGGVFRLLRSAWDRHNLRLVDMKVEFGVGPDGVLRLADVIDNDSWRITEDGAYLDKQVYRDGGNLTAVARNYARIAHLAGQLTA